MGGGGFIGNRLQQKLGELGLNFVAPPSYELDLCNQYSVKQLRPLLGRCDAIVFLACITPDRADGPQAFRSNVKMAQHLDEALDDLELPIVYLSSDAIYGNISVVRLDTAPCPATAYGEAHFYREELFGLRSNVTVIRPTMVYGKGDTHFSYGPNRFLRQIKQNMPIELFGCGGGLRDFVFLEDVINAIVFCIRNSVCGTFNLVSGRSISFLELALKILNFFPGGQLVHNNRTRSITHRIFSNDAIFHQDGCEITSIDTGLSRLIDC